MDTDSDNTDDILKPLSQRVAASDPDAFEHVFKLLFEDAVLYARHITRRDAAAQDVVQDAFAKLWQVRTTLAADRSLRPYFFRIVRNMAYNQVRNRTTRRTNETIHGERQASATRVLPDDVTEARLLQRQLDAWIAALPERQREAITLCRFENLSHEEIAAIMDISPRTVNNHIVRAMKALRAQMKTYRADLL